VHLRVDKSFRVIKQHQVKLRLNVWNLLNLNTVLDVNKRSGPTFMRPIASQNKPPIYEPRVLEIGASYVF
jgi:hypothetical protein